MDLRRVVITGLGAVSPFGKGVDSLMTGLWDNQSGISVLPELAKIDGMRTRVGARVPGIDPKVIPRKYRRSMSVMSVYATLACQEAVAMGRLGETELSSGRLGVSIGSTVGSPNTTHDFYSAYILDQGLGNLRATQFFQFMNHSCASNVVQILGIKGRMMAPSAACSTGNLALGYGYEMIAFGKQEMMLCGGADELHPLSIATFDIINAASIRYNDRPRQTPRPFDRDRDGMVCAEGCGILLLESLESALGREVPILAEVVGFSLVSDPVNLADPHVDSIESCLRQALKEAAVTPEEVSYVNAHATGTVQGDAAEAEAVRKVFGGQTPVSSLKGHLGHTMAASGALETIASIGMMDRNRLIPTLNLENIDPLCRGIRHIQNFEDFSLEVILKNNFALGGVNSCVVLRRYRHDR